MRGSTPGCRRRLQAAPRPAISRRHGGRFGAAHKCERCACHVFVTCREKRRSDGSMQTRLGEDYVLYARAPAARARFLLISSAGYIAVILAQRSRKARAAIDDNDPRYWLALRHAEQASYAKWRNR